MNFIDSYKHLEKLCGEILNDDRKLSAYIDEMINTPNGSVYVPNWNEDLNTLKHYRWVRNQIVHEPGCNESNMCEPEDEIWLNNFYSRIMNQTDPLAMYSKACSATKRFHSHTQTSPSYQTRIYRNNSQPRQKHHYSGIILGGIILIILLIWLSN